MMMKEREMLPQWGSKEKQTGKMREKGKCDECHRGAKPVRGIRPSILPPLDVLTSRKRKDKMKIKGKA